MNLRSLLAPAAAAVLLLAAAPSQATITDNTSWSCAAHETFKVSGSPKVVTDRSGIGLDFDGMGNFEIYLPDPDEFYDGTVVAKGKTGFLATPDPTGVADLQDYVAGLVKQATGADTVSITSFKWGIKGKVKNGILLAVLKAKGKGTVSLDGRIRHGSGKLTQVLVSASE